MTGLHILGLYALFYLGFVASLLLQAQTSASSDSNSLGSAWDWIKLHGRIILGRLIACTIFLPVIIHYVPSDMSLPTWSVYGAAGFISDSVLDKVLFIFGKGIGAKVEVPQMAPPANAQVVSQQPRTP